MSKIPIDEKTGLPTLEDGYGLTKSERTKSSAAKKSIFSTKRSFLVNFFILWAVLEVFTINQTLFYYGLLGIAVYLGIKFYQIPRMKVPKNLNNNENNNKNNFWRSRSECCRWALDSNDDIYDARTGIAMSGSIKSII